MAAKKTSIQVNILGDSSGLKKALDDTDSRLKKFQDKAKEVGDKLQTVGKNLTTKLTLPIVGLGAVAFNAAADLEDAMGAADQIYGKAAENVKNWAKKLPSYYGVATGEGLQYANIMGTMLMNIGGQTEEAAGKTAGTLVELAGDLTAMYGGSTQDAINALTGALKGNNTMLDNYGISALDAEVKAKALEMGIYDGTGALTAQQKQAATLAVIMEQTGAAQGQAAREADGASGQMRALTTEFKNISAEAGQKLLPIGQKVLGWVSGLMDKFSSLDDKTQNIILVIAGVVAAIGPLMWILGTLATAIGFIASPIGLVVIAIAALVAGFVWLYNTSDGFREMVNKIVSVIWDVLQVAFNWITKTAIPAVVAAFISIRDFMVPKVKAAFETIKDIFNKAKEAIKAVADWVGPKIETAFGIVKAVFEAVASFVTDTLWPAIQGFIDWVSAVMSPVLDGLADTWSEVVWPALKLVGDFIADVLWPIFKTLVDFIVDVFMVNLKALAWVWTEIVWPALKKIWLFISDYVIPIFEKIISTIVDVAKWVGIKIGEIVGFVLGIPAKIKRTIESLWNGLTNGITTAKNWVSDRLNDMIWFIAGLPGRIGSAASGMWDGIKNAFKSALNWIIDKWNGLRFKLPSVSFMGKTIGGTEFGVPRIPRFHDGGVVGGRLNGDEVLAKLLKNEVVFNQDQVGRLQSAMNQSNQPTKIVLNFNGPVSKDSVKWVADQVEEAVRKGYGMPRLKSAMR